MNNHTASKIVDILLDDPIHEVNNEFVDAVRFWATNHLDYVKSITEETPARIKMQIKSNLNMQIKVTGLLSMMGSFDYKVGAMFLRQSYHARLACYQLIDRTVEEALGHLNSLPITPWK